MLSFQVLLLSACLAAFVALSTARVECDPPCDPGRCCVRIWLPGRKRQVQHNPTLHCLPLKKEGDYCRMAEVDNICPCGEGLSCQSPDASSLYWGKCLRQ